MLTQQETRILKKYAFDAKTGFIGVEPLYQKLRHLNQPISRAKIKEFMATNEIAQVFRPPKRAPYWSRAKRRAPKTQPKIVSSVGGYQADLTFFNKYKSRNSGYYILLTLININSKKGYTFPLKKKNQAVVLNALKQLISIIEDYDVPVSMLQTDNGTEFKNKLVGKWCESKGIKQVFCQEGDKACLGVAERFNLTLKQRIEKWIAYNQNTRWIDGLADILENYNTTYHTSIQMAPFEMELADEVDCIREKVIHNENFRKQHDKIQVGDRVRLANKRGAFHKIGQNWSSEVFDVIKVNLNSLLVDGRNKKYKPHEVLVVNKDALDVNQEFRSNQRRNR